MPNQWNYLVSETQFANELVVAGLRKLCAVPPQMTVYDNYSQTYPLHIGLHSYTSGLERLCKLTIACHGFINDGKFPKLRDFGHRISELLDSVEHLDLSRMALTKTPPERLKVGTDQAIESALDRFANGAGRYEHLDSLWNDQASVSTFEAWTELCSRVAVTERIGDLLLMRGAIMSAMQTIAADNDVEAATGAMYKFLDANLYLPSIGLALHLYDKASWVAETLDALTYYTNTSLPLLGEAVIDLKQPRESFFQYSIALIEDGDVTRDELEKYFKEPEDTDES